jgi:hypothetical protein
MHMFEPIWEKEKLAVLSGAPKTYSLRSEGSGKEVVVHFCDACGTKLYLSFERFPQVVGIYGGTLDHPTEAVAGADHSSIFLDEAQRGCIIPAGMKTWRRHKATNAGEPIAPAISDQPLVT